MSGKNLDSYELEVVLDEKIVADEPVLIQTVTSITEIGAIVGLSSIITSASTSAAANSSSGGGGGSKFNSARFWMLVEAMQICNYMLYINIPLPQILKKFFRILSLSNASFMPNIFDYFVEDAELPPPPKFAEEDEGTNFLLTAGDVLGVILSNFALLIFIAGCI